MSEESFTHEMEYSEEEDALPAQQDLIRKLGRGPPGVEPFVLPKNRLVPKVEAPLYNDSQIDGQQEPVDIK